VAAAAPREEFPPEDVPSKERRFAPLVESGYAQSNVRIRYTPRVPAAPHETLPDPDPNACRAFLVINMPRELLAADFERWGDFDLKRDENAVHARALSFMCAMATRTAANTMRGQVRVFAEAVVRNAYELPVTDPLVDDAPDYSAEELTNKVFVSSNVMGYRLWIFFGQGAPDPEVALRRTMIAAQEEMRLVPPEVAQVKQDIMVVPCPETRHALIKERAMRMSARKRAAGDGARKKPRRDGEPDDAASEGEAEPEEDLEAAALAAGTVAARLEAMCYTQPTAAAIGRLSGHKMRHACNLWRGVVSLDIYLGHVMASAHMMSRSLKKTNDLWGVQPALVQPWAESLWLPGFPEKEAVSAEFRWSFEQSMLAFYDDARQNSACDLQLLPAAYGMPDGLIYFPYRHLVWELAPEGLEPLQFFGARVPWTGLRFDAEVRRIAQAVRQAKFDALSDSMQIDGRVAGAPADASESLQKQIDVMVLGAPDIPKRGNNNKARLAIDAVVPADQRRCDLLLDTFTRLELTREYAAEPIMLQTNNEGRTVTEVLVAATVEIYSRYVTMMSQVEGDLVQMAPPAGYDPAVWREQQMLELHKLYRTDLQNALLGAITRGEGIHEAHSAMYEQMVRVGRVSDLYRPEWCRLPQMSVEANAYVSVVQQIGIGLGMQHGVLEVAELLHVAALQATDPEPRDMVNVGLMGAGAIGKSRGNLRGMEALLRGMAVIREYESNAHGYTHDRDGAHIYYTDEAKDLITDQTRNGQRRNANALARLKAEMSSGVYSFERFERMEGDAKSRTLRVQAHRPGVHVFCLNYADLDPGVDSALYTRFDLNLFMPFVVASLPSVVRAHDINTDTREAMWRGFCVRHQEELAFKVFLTLLARARVINSVNIDVLTAMLAAALRDSADYVPEFGEAMRAAGRNEQYAIQMVFSTAFYTTMRSEASDLLTWTNNKGAYAVRPVYTAEVTENFAPHLYARVDHGCWMLTRMVFYGLPYSYYMLMRAIAGLRAGFRREFFKDAYRRHGARLIDDELAARLRERDETGRTLPEFVQELLRQEHLLDHEVLRERHFVPTAPPDFLQNESTPVASFGGARAGSGERVFGGGVGGDGAIAGAVAGVASCDPNWIVIRGSLRSVIKSVLHHIQSYYRVDEAQLVSVMNHAAGKIVLKVPVFRRLDRAAADVKPDVLDFERSARDKSGTTILYERRSLFEVHKGYVRFSTAGLMIPPHMLLVMMLTASETCHTTPRQTVLPLPVENNATLMHTWQVCRRPNHNPVTANYNALTHDDMRMERRGGVVMPAVLGATVHVAGADIERVAFYRHMRALHIMPPYAKLVDLLRAIKANVSKLELTADNPHPTAAQVDEAFKMWADLSSAAPGNAAMRRAWAAKNAPTLAATDALEHETVYYPQSQIVGRATQQFIIDQATRSAIVPLPKPPVDRSIHGRLAALDLVPAAPRGSPAYLAYRTQRTAIKALVLRLASAPWWSEHFVPYANSVEWRHLFPLLSAMVWGRTASTNMRNGELPPGPLAPNAKQAEILAAHSGAHTTFSRHHLQLLADWMHFQHTTRRIAVCMMHYPHLLPQQAFDYLLNPDFASIELETTNIVRGAISASKAGISKLTSDQKEKLEAYHEQKHIVRALRAPRLAALMRTAEEHIAAEMAAATTRVYMGLRAGTDRRVGGSIFGAH
jgi:hypothetical protein